jgi:FAD/FMN-containing dehydrogenase
MTATGPGPKRHRSRQRFAVVAAVLLLVLLVGAPWLDRYSGGSTHVKECAIHGVAPPPSTDMTPVPTAVRSDEDLTHLTQRGGTVNDASCLNRTEVFGVLTPHTETEISEALAFARAQQIPVTASGTRHSMGGQASFPNGLVLDMQAMNQITVDTERQVVRVQPGATWRDVLEAVHPHGLSVAAMPSIDVLSVGGTISVNAHGADFRTGSLSSTVRSLRVMLPDGTVHRLDRTHEPELFRAVIGGYGLFGVILEAELELMPLDWYDMQEQVVDTGQFADHFSGYLVPDPDVRMMYAHLSTSPDTLLEQAIVYTYRRVDDPAAEVPTLRVEQDSRVGRLVLNMARTGEPGSDLKWAAQQHLLPHVRSCVRSRNDALTDAEACLVTRNQAMYNDLGLLNNRLDQYTDILQEYFLPPDQLAPFLTDAANVLRKHEAVLLSGSIRSVNPDHIKLSYATSHRLSVVLYLSQHVDPAGVEDMATLTRTLIDLALVHGGTFYLPYQQHYTRAQLEAGYPQIDEFFALKRSYDAQLLLNNSFYHRYAQG